MFLGIPEATISRNVESLREATGEFVSMFELVLDNDWPTTRTNTEESAQIIDRKGASLRPLVPDEDNDWAIHGALLRAYRHLLQCMQDCGIQRQQSR